MNRFETVVFFSMLLFSLTVLTSATEHGERYDGCIVGEEDFCDRDTHQREYGERFVEVREVSEDRMEMESKLVNTTDNIEDKFQIYVDTNNTLEITLRYKEENLSADEKDIAETSITFDRLIEYRDVNGNGEIERGEVVTHNRIERYQPIDLTKYTEDNATIHRMTATTLDETFKVAFYATGDFANLGSIVVTPSDMKFDVTINEYDYENTNTSLALGAVIDADTEWQDGAVIFGGGGKYDTVLSWKDTAEVEGEERTVNVSTFGNKIAMSYGKQVENVFHDPKVGFRPSKDTGLIRSIINVFKSAGRTLISTLPF